MDFVEWMKWIGVGTLISGVANGLLCEKQHRKTLDSPERGSTEKICRQIRLFELSVSLGFNLIIAAIGIAFIFFGIDKG